MTKLYGFQSVYHIPERFAASIRKDIVSTRLNSNECNSQFYNHMNNECYKAYTPIKKLSKL